MFNKYFNVPNFFSACRILFSPFIYYFLSVNNSFASFVLIFFGGLTDVLDGFFARKLNQTSYFGAKLDSFADFLFLSAFVIFFMFSYLDKLQFFAWQVFAGAGFLFCTYIVVFVRFRKFASFHLYSMKTSSFLWWLNAVYFSLSGINFLLVKISIIVWFFACVETFFASIMIKRIEYNLRSVFLLK